MENPSPEKDYRSTVHLPKTDFPMKGNLAKLEPSMLARWTDEGAYARMIERNAGTEPFVFHDGPPYANGHLHAGHALNKILKDIVVKYRNLSGHRCDFVPGWDCHGLPIELAVEKRLKEKKIDKRSLSREALLEHCRAYATEFLEIQKAEFKRLGVFADWDHPYATLTFDYEAQEIRELAAFAKAGALYRKKKPVYWCLADRTALAEAEVEYEDHDSPSVYVAFRAVPAPEGVERPKHARAETLDKAFPKLAGKAVDFVIWTTTPWTLPANLAIAVHPELEYVFYPHQGRVLCVAKELLGKVLSALGVEGEPDESAILETTTGDALEGFFYAHPFYGAVHPFLKTPYTVTLGEHVTLDAGTGLVHTAPGHGQEDYQLGLAYGLPVYNPVKDDGRYDETVGPELAGKSVWEANALVSERMAALGALLNPTGQVLRHSYPHCWRCRNPVIFRATDQWFISLAANDLRARALAEVDRVKWIPRWGKDRIQGMLEARPDWCISRQRWWGVPIPVALCEDCGEPLVSAELMEKVAASVEKEGAGAWYVMPVEAFLPEGHACACGGKSFRKETDILDVWFDSACSFAAVAAKREGMRVPVDLYLEGSDQHRGWFHSSLLVSVGTRGKAPYESVLTHGFVVDGQGKKMSKSRGNTISPEQVIKKHGAEVLRLWVAASDYRDDVRLSEQILQGLSESYRRIRNTLRWALGNLADFDVTKDSVPAEKLMPLDRWARARLAKLVSKVREAYEAYEFHLVYHHVVDFCAMDLSALWFDILKDTLYTARVDAPERRSAQTVLHEVASTLCRLLAPVISFTAEEAWGHLPGHTEPSVFLARMPEADPKASDPALEAEYERLWAVRAEVQKDLEAARQSKRIGASLEAKVVLTSPKAKSFLAAHLDELPKLFITSQVVLSDEHAPDARSVEGLEGGTWLEIRPADGAKCPRCWKFHPAVAQGHAVCPPCEVAIQ